MMVVLHTPVDIYDIIGTDVRSGGSNSVIPIAFFSGITSERKSSKRILSLGDIAFAQK